MNQPNANSLSEQRDRLIDESIESLDKFIRLVELKIDGTKKELKAKYMDYLQRVENGHNLTVSFASFRKADGIYTKLMASLDKFIVALTADHVTVRSTADELKLVSGQYAKLIRERTDKSKLPQMQQLITKIKKVIKQFNDVVKDYREKTTNLFILQHNLKNNVIIYTSLSGKSFRIFIKNDTDEFMELLGLDNVGALYDQLNTKFTEELTADMGLLDHDKLNKTLDLNIVELNWKIKPEPIDAEMTYQAKKRKREDEDKLGPKKPKVVSLLLKSKITVEDLKGLNMISDDVYSAEQTDTLLRQVAHTWNLFRNMDDDTFVGLESFEDFCDEFSFLIPIMRDTLHKMNQIKKTYREVMELEDELRGTDVESLDDVLAKNDPKIIEAWYEYLQKRKRITELVHYYLYYLLDKQLSGQMLDYNESTIEELAQIRKDVYEFKLVSVVYGEVLEELRVQIRGINQSRRELMKKLWVDPNREKSKRSIGDAYKSLVEHKIQLLSVVFEAKQTGTTIPQEVVDKHRQLLEEHRKDFESKRENYYSRYRDIPEEAEF